MTQVIVDLPIVFSKNVMKDNVIGDHNFILICVNEGEVG